MIERGRCLQGRLDCPAPRENFGFGREGIEFHISGAAPRVKPPHSKDREALGQWFFGVLLFANGCQFEGAMNLVPRTPPHRRNDVRRGRSPTLRDMFGLLAADRIGSREGWGTQTRRSGVAPSLGGGRSMLRAYGRRSERNRWRSARSAKNVSAQRAILVAQAAVLLALTINLRPLPREFLAQAQQFRVLRAQVREDFLLESARDTRRRDAPPEADADLAKFHGCE